MDFGASRLTDQERDFLKRRLNGEPVKDIASSYNLSPERIRQIIAAAGQRIAEHCAAAPL